VKVPASGVDKRREQPRLGARIIQTIYMAGLYTANIFNQRIFEFK
jgi:hypothetical protein